MGKIICELKSALLLSLSLLALAACDRRHSLHLEESTAINGSSVFKPTDKAADRTVLILTHYLNPLSGQIEVSRCSGFALSRRIILTAAHCVQFDHFLKGEIQSSIHNRAASFDQRKVKIHPEYKRKVDRFDYEELRDIALIRVNSDIATNLMPFAFLGSDPGKRFSFRVLGYGQTQGSFLKKEEKSATLRQALVAVADFDFKRAYFEIYQPAGGICFGDSGGPAFIGANGDEFLFGMAVEVLFDPSKVFVPSYDGCRERGIFLNLHYFKDWLRKTYLELLRLP